MDFTDVDVKKLVEKMAVENLNFEHPRKRILELNFEVCNNSNFSFSPLNHPIQQLTHQQAALRGRCLEQVVNKIKC